MIFNFLKKERPKKTLHDLFTPVDEIVDSETGVFYTISKLMPIHIALAEDSNLTIFATKLIACSVKRDDAFMQMVEVETMDLKLFHKLIGVLNKQL